MITLYTFGPAFGLPDPSPFVVKAELLLKMAGLAYRTKRGGLRRAPKGKLPYIDDDGERIGDSTFIRWHIEKKYGHDFDRGLSASERAVAWAFEKMADEQLYWVLVDLRWIDDANFDRGTRQFFQALPAPVRVLAIPIVRRKIRNAMYAQGMGRHSRAEIGQLGARSIAAIADYLGEKPFFMGSEPTAADAALFPCVAAILSPMFQSPARNAAERHTNLGRYSERMMERYYPEYGRRTTDDR
jgi:glutathione S-transferase